MWKRLRRVWRIGLIVLITGGMWVLRMCVMLLRPVAPAAERAIVVKMLHGWAAMICRAINLHIDVRGTAPKAPYILATNHLTYIDIVLLSYTAGCVLISRGDVEHWPVIGAMAKSMNTLFIDRAKARDTKRINELIAGLLETGHGIHFFAEGGISQDARVSPFKPPLLQPAVDAQQPVYYAALSYATRGDDPRASESVVWREPDSFGQNVMKVLMLNRIDAVVSFGDAPISGDDRKVLAQQLYEGVAERFVPMRDDEPAATV